MLQSAPSAAEKSVRLAEKCNHMSDSVLVEPVPMTPLAAHLSSAAKSPRLIEYHGALTPQELDVLGAEIEALVSGAAVHDLGWFRRVVVRGDDRLRWLSGMVTNTVSGLEPNTGAWNLVLNAQGRIQGDLTVWREGHAPLTGEMSTTLDPALTLEIAADQYEHLHAHLEHFIIMDDVELLSVGVEPGSEETALGLAGPHADEVLQRMGLPTLSEPMTCTRVEWNGLDLRILRGYGSLVPHYELWTPVAGVVRLWRTCTTAGAVPVGCRTLEAFRIAEGIPVYGQDMVERDLPQETSQLRALHFNKGCYLGQEIVERIRSRGSVHRHLRQLELHGPLPAHGTELVLEGTVAGNITSTAELQLPNGRRTFALAMLRADAESRNELLTYSTGVATGTARILAAPPTLSA